MISRVLSNASDRRIFALVFDKDEEATSALEQFAAENGIAGAAISGIGAFKNVTLGYFDRQKKEYKPISIREQVEVVALTGNFAQKDGKPKLHCHVVVGKSDGTAHGGHLLRGEVWPTLELIVEESAQHLSRRIDEETGLPLLDLAA